ncbi:MAG: uncharacterized protein QOC87_649 [Actinomycetota bacterium]|nr:uncharacterized protein [Actinomycetota bacterium]
MVRSIRCIQVDPISAIAPTQQLVLFSRLGPGYRKQMLADATYKRKELFHYWAHASSLVLTEDYPIHNLLMRTWPRRKGARADQTRRFMKDNAALQRRILTRLRREGPLRGRDFEGAKSDPWRSSGLTEGQSVGEMIECLWVTGKIMIVGRNGLERIWGLADDYFPEWMPRDRLAEREVVRRSVLLSLGALGVATRKQISLHFTRGIYPDLQEVLGELLSKGEIVPVEVDDDGVLPGRWFALAADVPLIQELGKQEDEGRTTLLSPFDNLICDRDRTQQLFGFEYRIEIYVPPADRRYGYYVMPILHGDRLIGRVDSRVDKTRNVYVVSNVYAEPTAPRDRGTARAVREAIDTMSEWLGVDAIEFGTAQAWSSTLR